MREPDRAERRSDAAPAVSPTAPAGRHQLLRLQTSAGNRAVGRLLMRDEKRPSWFMPSSPTIDIFAIQNQDLLITSRRPLSKEEIALGKSVYQDSLDFSRIQMAKTDVLSAPTTLGDTIRVKTETIDNATLIHELMHVWQYQTSGIAYMSCALAGQVQGTIAHGDRNWTYEYKPGTAGTKLADYGPEQQASIIEDAWKNKKLDDKEFYGRFVEEVRRARPRPKDIARDINERAGTTGPAQRATDYFGPVPRDPRSEEMGGNVPQLQWRF